MNNKFEKSVIESIKLRKSVRNYDNQTLSKEIIQKIENYINKIENPFNKEIRIKLIEKSEYNKEFKLGTYGVIKGANYFLAVACKNEDFSLEALGYTFEKLVLYCTSLGLGTVWLGGTFNKGEFLKAMNLTENEILPIVSPVGYEGGKKSFISRLIGNNNDKRKDFSEIFFNGSFNKGLSKEESGEYLEVLEMVRLAPSALNKQPWRILKDKNKFHFYMDYKNEMNKIDIGIAICHFHLTLQEKELDGRFEFDESNNIDSKFKYVISWVCE